MRSRMWTCHDGRKIPISQMHDDHLANAINMIYRGRSHKGNRVLRHTALLLPALLVEQEIRDIRKYDNGLWG